MKVFLPFAFAMILSFATIAFGQDTNARYMAWCNDGDGALTGWLTSREDAYIAGRDHERANRGHKWEVLVQDGNTEFRPSSCALVAEGSAKSGLVNVENKCGVCKTFRVTRKNADGTTKTKEFTVKPKSSRNFRKLPNSTIVVEGERDCPGS